jgi:hypothetical protein
MMPNCANLCHDLGEWGAAQKLQYEPIAGSVADHPGFPIALRSRCAAGFAHPLRSTLMPVEPHASDDLYSTAIA